MAWHPAQQRWAFREEVGRRTRWAWSSSALADMGVTPVLASSEVAIYEVTEA